VALALSPATSGLGAARFSKTFSKSRPGSKGLPKIVPAGERAFLSVGLGDPAVLVAAMPLDEKAQHDE